MFPTPPWFIELKSKLRGVCLPNHSLKLMTSIQTGGNAEVFVSPHDPEDLAQLYGFCLIQNIPITVLGRGTNTLIADEGIRGVSLRLEGPFFKKIEEHGDHQLLCGAAVLKSDLLQFAIEHHLAGLEFSSGIPGDIGGALRMNAGTKYGNYAERLVWVEVFRPELKKVEHLEAALCQSSYRHQTYIRDGIVTQALFQCLPGQSEIIQAEVNRIIAERAAKQPLEWPNFGSTFKNPEHSLSAGRLIEQSGLKGMRVGGAEISEKHANFILNKDHATSTDILELICLAQKLVYTRFQVWLEPEVILIGEFQKLPPKNPPTTSDTNLPLK